MFSVRGSEDKAKTLLEAFILSAHGHEGMARTLSETVHDREGMPRALHKTVHDNGGMTRTLHETVYMTMKE